MAMYSSRRVHKVLTRSQPTWVKIGPHIYDIMYDPKHTTLGSFMEEEQKIVIKAGLTTTMTAEVLLHELMHACCVSLSDEEDFNTANEEVIVAVTSYNLAQIFQDNPELIKWLLKALKV